MTGLFLIVTSFCRREIAKVKTHPGNESKKSPPFPADTLSFRGYLYYTPPIGRSKPPGDTAVVVDPIL